MADPTATYAPDDGTGIRRRGIVYQDEVDPNPVGLGRGKINPPLVNQPAPTPGTPVGSLRDVGTNFLPNARMAWDQGTQEVNGASNPASAVGFGMRRLLATGVGALDDTFRTPYNKFIAPGGNAAASVVPQVIAAGTTALTGNDTQPAAPSTAPSTGIAPPVSTAQPYPDTQSIRNPGVAPAAQPASDPAAVPNATTPTGINVTPTLDASTQAALSAAKFAAAGRTDPGAPGAAAPINLNQSGNGVLDLNKASSDAYERNELVRQGLRERNPQVKAAALKGGFDATTADAQNRATASAERIAGLRDRGETTRANALAESNRFIHAQDNAVSLRGQDAVLAGHRMANDVAVANQRREQFNSDRAYAMDVAKYGTDVAEKNRAAGEAAQKSNQTFLENQFRTTDEKGNSVPDQSKIASYNNSVQATLPSLINQLRSAGTPEALAKAHEIEQRGPAALGPADHADLTQLFNRREQLLATRSVLPGGANAFDSSDLTGYRQAPGEKGYQRNMLSPNRVVFANGSSATPNDLSIRGGANAFLPDINKVRTDDLTRGLRIPE